MESEEAEEADDDDGSAASEWETVSCLGSEDIRGSVNIHTCSYPTLGEMGVYLSETFGTYI